MTVHVNQEMWNLEMLLFHLLQFLVISTRFHSPKPIAIQGEARTYLH